AGLDATAVCGGELRRGGHRGAPGRARPGDRSLVWGAAQADQVSVQRGVWSGVGFGLDRHRRGGMVAVARGPAQLFEHGTGVIWLCAGVQRGVAGRFDRLAAARAGGRGRVAALGHDRVNGVGRLGAGGHDEVASALAAALLALGGVVPALEPRALARESGGAGSGVHAAAGFRVRGLAGQAGILKKSCVAAMAPTPIYLDYHATTPVDPRVWRAMEPYYTSHFGNPASNSHAFGWTAATAVQRARGQVAALIGAQPSEVVFTSGATESDNLAIKGMADRHRGRRAHVITTAFEHHAVLDPCARLEQEGFAVTRLGVDREGLVGLGELEAALRPETVLVSVMAVNNEIGVVQDMEAIGALTRRRGIALHSDATQAAGKLPVEVGRWNVDLLSLSGHKMYGPKGVGALYVRTGTRLTCQQDGGGHERGLRSGTLNVPGIVGLGEAAALAQQELREESARIGGLRDRLREGILSQLE